MPKQGDFFAFDRELADAAQARESSQGQDQEARRARALREALLAGLQSGTPRPFDFEAFKARKRASYASAS